MAACSVCEAPIPNGYRTCSDCATQLDDGQVIHAAPPTGRSRRAKIGLISLAILLVAGGGAAVLKAHPWPPAASAVPAVAKEPAKAPAKTPPKTAPKRSKPASRKLAQGR